MQFQHFWFSLNIGHGMGFTTTELSSLVIISTMHYQNLYQYFSENFNAIAFWDIMKWRHIFASRNWKNYVRIVPFLSFVLVVDTSTFQFVGVYFGLMTGRRSYDVDSKYVLSTIYYGRVIALHKIYQKKRKKYTLVLNFANIRILLLLDQ